MKTAGIIAEYNPFHNGHQFHIERTRQETGADFIIAVMSGDFVQRGTPALTDKYTRTKMALAGGADLVLELPVLFAAGSAGDFAAGAVSLLDKLGVVDYLCFGSEAGSVSPFQKAAALLACEPPEFSAILRRKLKQGLSFPLARSMALQSCLPGFLASKACGIPEASDGFPKDFPAGPNNILGLEYCTALYKRKSAIRPVTVKREGAGYHENALFAGTGNPYAFSSAAAIRSALYEMKTHPDLSVLSAFLPIGQTPLWQEILRKKRFLFPEDFTKELRCRLILEAADGFEQYADVSRELSGKLTGNCLTFADWDSLCERLKSKELTYSRISRALCHILLCVTEDELQAARSGDYTPYARILGFQKPAAPLLSSIKKNGSVPLISKLADAGRLLPKEALSILKKDITASHLYESAIAAKTKTTPQNEYTRQIIMRNR